MSYLPRTSGLRPKPLPQITCSTVYTATAFPLYKSYGDFRTLDVGISLSLIATTMRPGGIVYRNECFGAIYRYLYRTLVITWVSPDDNGTVPANTFAGKPQRQGV